MSSAWVVALLLLPAACGRGPEDPAAVTPDEQRQLNEAALGATGVAVNADDLDPNAADPANDD